MTEDEARLEYRRRRAAAEGCGQCCYCDLGAIELCRHYDLDLAVMDSTPAPETLRAGTNQAASAADAAQVEPEFREGPMNLQFSTPNTSIGNAGDTGGGEP
jgi:hypothetical protein